MPYSYKPGPGAFLDRAARSAGGLVAFLPLNERGALANFEDLTQNAAPTGTGLVAADWSPLPLPLGYGVKFSGVKGITIPSSAAIDNLAKFSVIAWISMASLAAGVVWAKDSSVKKWFGLDGASGHLELQVACATTTLTAISTKGVTAGKLAQVGGAWDGTLTAANVGLYINGAASPHGTDTNGVGAITSEAGLAGWIGNDSGLSLALTGTIGYVAVYNRVLTADDFARNYRDTWAMIAQRRRAIATLYAPAVGGPTTRPAALLTAL
jgi:hypothetical protein